MMERTGDKSTETRIHLAHGRIVMPGRQAAYLDDGHIVITGEHIESVSSDAPRGDGFDQVIDLQGKLVLPGMINAHTHLYSSLALGMPPPDRPPRNFVEKLKTIWWKLDRALDEDSVTASFEAGLIAALRSGVTTVIDHHSSQNDISGSLARLVETARDMGVTIATAFETTDRNGQQRFRAGLQENLETVTAYADDPLVLPMIGLHASFTLSDESLEAVGSALKDLNHCGIHIHVAEDQADQQDAEAKGYPSVVQRLQSHGLVNDRSLFIHGLHIIEDDVPILKNSGVAIVHNPTSNANNRVGVLQDAVYHALEIGLGTDGMQANMLKEAREGTLIRSSHLPGGSSNIDYAALLFENNPHIVSRLFGCKLGLISPGYIADLAIYEYNPATVMNTSNLTGHVLYGLDKPTDVMTRGVFRIRNNRMVDIPEDDIMQRTRSESNRLWLKMQAL